VAEVFKSMADGLAIQGEDPHRILAYRRAAENILALGRPIETVWREGELASVPGIGRVLTAKIDELMRTGRLEAYERLRAQVPAGVVAMLQVPGVGPKRAALIWRQLGITSIDGLERAAREGLLRDLPGIGGGTEQRVLAGIAELRARAGPAQAGEKVSG
jgi:DNA polymerase (family 10)